MTRTQAAEIAVLQSQVTRIEADIRDHAEKAEKSATVAAHDRQKMIDLLGDISKQVSAKDAATNKRIDDYEAEARGGKKVLLALSAAWGLLTSSAGAALMYWLKSGSPMPPGR
jgi:hypothetical protein